MSIQCSWRIYASLVHGGVNQKEVLNIQLCSGYHWIAIWLILQTSSIYNCVIYIYIYIYIYIIYRFRSIELHLGAPKMFFCKLVNSLILCAWWQNCKMICFKNQMTLLRWWLGVVIYFLTQTITIDEKCCFRLRTLAASRIFRPITVTA